MSKRERLSTEKVVAAEQAAAEPPRKRAAAAKASSAAAGTATPPLEPDGVKYLRAKVTRPQPGHESACVDISDPRFWEQSGRHAGRCNVAGVLREINAKQMWMVGSADLGGHRVAYEKAVKEALKWLYNIPDAVPQEVHDGLVQKFDTLQETERSEPSLLSEEGEGGHDAGAALPVGTVQWGDAADTVQKASRRSWMMTAQGKQHLQDGRFAFCAYTQSPPNLISHGCFREVACDHRRLRPQGERRPRDQAEGLPRPQGLPHALPSGHLPRPRELTRAPRIARGHRRGERR